MASAKSSRSRPAGHSGVFPVGGAAMGAGGGGAGAGGGDGGVQLADKLKIFKTDNFDPDAYVQSKCQTMNEKVSQLSLRPRLRSIHLHLCLPSLDREWWEGVCGVAFAGGACDRGSCGGDEKCHVSG